MLVCEKRVTSAEIGGKGPRQMAIVGLSILSSTHYGDYDSRPQHLSLRILPSKRITLIASLRSSPEWLVLNNIESCTYAKDGREYSRMITVQYPVET